MIYYVEKSNKKYTIQNIKPSIKRIYHVRLAEDLVYANFMYIYELFSY